MIKVSFKTQNGHYLIANDARTHFGIAATPSEVGPWEVFTIIPLSGDEDVIHNGGKIHLRTHHGRYVMARRGGGGAVTGEATLPQEWETFTIETSNGDAEIAPGALVTLRTSNGINFLMARDGGGVVVNADSTNRAEWETFSVGYWNPAVVRLQSHYNQYLAAENGGGREITANRDAANIWETFVLINRSRKSGIQSGDSVSLQVWDGRFISAEGGGGGRLLANADRAGRFEIFTINKRDGGEIRLFDSVSFRTQNGHYVMALEGGGATVDASSTQAQEWETFRFQKAEWNPIPFASAPTAPVRAGHPLPSRITPKTGRRKLICFLIGFPNSRVDGSISTGELRSFFFGTYRTWLEKVSYGAFTIVDGGVFAGLSVPWNYVPDAPQPDSTYFPGILDQATRQGLRFRDLDTDHNGRINGEELLLVVVDCSNIISGQHRPGISFRYDGVSYSGEVFTVGIYSEEGPVQGIAQLENIFGTVAHESSHMFFSLTDRYYGPYPPRGDVIATAQDRPDEKFAIIGPVGTDVPSGSRIRLRMGSGGDFITFDNSVGGYLNRGSTRSDPFGEFVIEKDGGGSIRHGDEVSLKAHATNQYLMANKGGGDVVQVIVRRDTPGTWERFTIERDAGVGVVSPRDPVTLKTSSENVYGRSFYLIAERNGRKTDAGVLSRGWWELNLSGDGVGGDYDIMDNDKHRGIIAAYDRIKLGWIVPKVLTPDNKACYVLNASIESPEAFVLWDPTWPDEWYVVENRQRREGLDETPSSGLIISWVNERTSYWSRWHHNGDGKSSAVISAAAPTAPPNCFVELVMLRDEVFKRRHPNTAFRSGTFVLPRGDGSPSRFRLSFSEFTAEHIEFCIL